MFKPARKKDNRPKRDESKEFDRFILDLARVTRVTKGGKHLSFRVCVVMGDRKGQVGFGVAKGKDVQIGVEKAVRQARKNMIKVPIIKETIPHAILSKFKAAQVMLKPAPVGSGIIAGGAVRVVLDLAGVPNISAKILSKSKNKITTLKATFKALQSFQNKPRNITKKDIKKEGEKIVEKAKKVTTVVDKEDK